MRLILLTTISLFALGCKSDERNVARIDSSFLQGKWEVINAIKNGKETKLLDRSILDFHGKKVDANFCGAKDASFSVTDNQFIIKTPSKEFKFDVKDVTNDEIMVHLNALNSDYDIVFKHK